jgi:hypothetical protein
MPQTTAEWLQASVAVTGFISLVVGLFLNYRRDTASEVHGEHADLTSDYERVKGQRDECRQIVEDLRQEVFQTRGVVEDLKKEIVDLKEAAIQAAKVAAAAKAG